MTGLHPPGRRPREQAHDPSRRAFDLGPEAGIAYLDQKLVAMLHAKRSAGIRVPGIDELNSALQAAAARGPVPAIVGPGTNGRDDFLRIYIDGQYSVSLNVTTNGRGYLIWDVHPLRLRDQDEIIRGNFALAARMWRIYHHPGQLPHYLDSRWPEVKNAWRSRPAPGQSGPRPRLPRDYSRYLDTLARIVDKAREIELSGTPADRICRYHRITPVAARRRKAQSVYKFQLMGDGRIAPGTRVHIEDHPDLRGEVIDLKESLVTVRFEQPLDFGQIPQLGSFLASPSTITMDKQAEAIEMLRDGRGHNPLLLDALVGHSFRSFQGFPAEPREKLDESQLAAFKMALSVPDLALVQGPPGTGKTRMIKQVVWEHAVSPWLEGPVLVSAYTNQAVDNVIKDLPDSLTVIRVGRGVTEAAEHLTLEAQATRLQRRILDRTEPGLGRYAVADPESGAAVQWLREFDFRRKQADEAAARVRQVTSELEQRDAEIAGPLSSRLAILAGELAAGQTVLTEREQRIARATAARERTARMASRPVIGKLFRNRLQRTEAETARAVSARDQARSELGATSQLHAQAGAELNQVRAADSVLAGLRERMERERRSWNWAARMVADVAGLLRDGLRIPDADELPVVSAADPESMAVFHEAASRAITLAQRRLGLLRHWRLGLERRTEQLYPELIRYADVVGATCIGAASSEHLSNVTFALALIDEAGQISTPNLLVPLVRASRAVLVGDHRQLPPFREDQLARWAADEDPALADLVDKSAFELLFPYVPSDNRKLLRIQRRMPRAIGNFISAQFYAGQLETDTDRAGRDELFASTMAFIDTSALPASRRCERKPRADEPWPRHSHVNDTEAELIADLVTYYDSRNSDWVVIVPFLAQKGLVSSILADRLANEEHVASRVASVDSFQGGEHDTVLFGFTRSNNAGAVGFFDDTRRFNVAFSRARRRLIMIGDLSTLCNARDPGFRSMTTELVDYLRLHGDLREYREIGSLLKAETRR